MRLKSYTRLSIVIIALAAILSGCAMALPGGLGSLAVGRGSVTRTAHKTEVTANARGLEMVRELTDAELLSLLMRLVELAQQQPQPPRRTLLGPMGPWEDRP